MISLNDDRRIFDELELIAPTHVAYPWYVAGLERQRISLTDCQTIRDLLEICQIEEENGLQHLMLLALFAVRNEGSLCLPMQALETVLRPFAGDEPALATEWAALIQAQLVDGRWSRLVEQPTQAKTPLVLDGQNLYWRKFHTHESSLEQRIKTLCRTGRVSDTATDELTELVQTASEFDGFSLNSEQRWGVYLACLNRFAVISGGPGTGKTTMVASLLRALHRLAPLAADRVVLVAPTGRAAHRLGDSLRATLQHAPDPEGALAALGTLEGRTIHRLLRYNPSKHAFVHHADNPIEADVVICDEVSMIDVVLMDQLLAAIPAQARVIFLGDRDQLPSVEAGAVLGDLIPKSGTPAYLPATVAALGRLALDEAAKARLVVATGSSPLTDRVVLLQQSHRTRGRVSELAQCINRGESAAVAALPVITTLTDGEEWGRDGSEVWRVAETLAATGVATDWVRQLLITDPCEGAASYAALAAAPLLLDDDGYATDPAGCQTLFNGLARGQILTVTRHGAGGCDTLNYRIVKQLRGELDSRSASGDALFTGMPVMVTRNDHLRDLFNGDVGIIRRLPDGDLVAIFPRGEQRYEAIPTYQLPAHVPAFAITVHKSQGSEYGNVMMVLPKDAGHRLLTREILYTGITRSQGNVYIHSSVEALTGTINRRIERYSGTDLWG